MKNFLILLTTAGLSLFSLFAQAGGGGVSGGTNAAKYITVEVCNGGESGEECHFIRLKKDSEPSPSSSNGMELAGCLTMIGDAQVVPCSKENVEYQIPKILQKLNNIFGNQGQPTVQPDLDGPN